MVTRIKSIFQRFIKSFISNKRFLFIFIIAFFIYLSSNMLSLTLPKYADDLGATAQAVGLLAGIFQIAALTMRPISGQIVDNENHLKMLRLVLLFILISILGFIFSKSYWMLVAFRALHGLSWGVGSTLCMTIATGCFTTENMTTGIGTYGLGQVIARIIAPIFAVPLSQILGYNVLYVGNLGIIILCLFFTLFINIESPVSKKRIYSYSLKKMIYYPALMPTTMVMCNSMAKSAVQAFLIIYASRLSINNIGLYFTIQAIAICLSRPLLAKLADKYGAIKVLVPCELFTIAGLVIISFANNLPLFLLSSIIMGIGTSGEQPILMAECVKNAPREKYGSASNTSYTGTDIGGFIGSNVAGFLVGAIGFSGMFLSFTIPVIVCTSVFMFYHFQQNRKMVLQKTLY